MLRLDFASFKYPPSPKVLEAIKNGCDSLNEYPDETYDAVREALSIKYELPKEFFMAGNGLDETIDIITRTFVMKNEEAMILTPTFSQFEEACIRVNGKPKLINCLNYKEYAIEPDTVLNNIGPHTKIIWICSPNNPTGEYTPIEVIEEIVSKSNTIVVVDEALSDFSGKTAIRLLKKYDNLIILKTFSKGYCLAGLRIGFCVANAHIIKKIENKKQIFNVNTLALKAAIAALEDQKYYDKLWEDFKIERSKEIAAIENLGIFVAGKESNFLLLDFETTERSKQIYSELLRKGIKVFPGWDKEFTNLPGKYCRVVVGRPEENKLFIDALTQIFDQMIFKNYIPELLRTRNEILGEKELNSININECDEKLCNISEYLDVKIMMSEPRKKYQDDENLYARESVCLMLQKASKKLPQGHSFIIFDAYRAVEYQQYRFEQLFNKIKSENPSLNSEEIRAKTFVYIFPPSLDLKTPPPHSTGGAIDLSIMGPNGKLLDMGTEYGEFNDKTYTNNDQISWLQRRNRKMLIELMISAGFTNYPGEWWHFMYGDREWAAYNNQPNAIYTRINADNIKVKNERI